MNWQQLAETERENAILQRLAADDARAKEQDSRRKVDESDDTEAGAIWTMLAVKHRIAAVSAESAADISDAIVDFVRARKS